MNWIGLDRILFAQRLSALGFRRSVHRAAADPDRRAARQDLRRQRAGALPAAEAEPDGKKHVVAAVGDIPPGGRKLVEVNGRAIVVFNLGGEFFALSNRCPHRGGSLCEGKLTGLVLVGRARRLRLHPPRARSSAAPGTPGSSTSAPASPGAIPTRCTRALCGLGGEGREAGRRALCGRDLSGQRRERLRGGRGVGVGEGIAGPAIALAAARSRADRRIDFDRLCNANLVRFCIIQDVSG